MLLNTMQHPIQSHWQQAMTVYLCVWSTRTTHACQGMARLVSRVGDPEVVRHQEGKGVQPG